MSQWVVLGVVYLLSHNRPMAECSRRCGGTSHRKSLIESRDFKCRKVNGDGVHRHSLAVARQENGDRISSRAICVPRQNPVRI